MVNCGLPIIEFLVHVYKLAQDVAGVQRTLALFVRSYSPACGWDDTPYIPLLVTNMGFPY